MTVIAEGDTAQRLHQARLLAEQLHVALFDPADSGCQVIRGREGVANSWAAVSARARQEIRRIGRLPAPTVRSVLTATASRRRPPSCGVCRRFISATSSVSGDDPVDRADHAASPPVDLRLLDTVPLRLVIADADLAMVCSARTEPAEAVLVTAPSLILELSMSLFESLWATAVPIGGSAPVAEDRSILALLAAGLDDRSIGRQLHLSTRTVQRRVNALLGRLDATTRLQAGVHAARRGWV